MTDPITRARKRRLSMLCLILGLGLVLLWGGLKLYRVVRPARSLLSRLEEAQALAGSAGQVGWQSLDAAWLGEMVHGTRADYLALKAEAEPWLWLTAAAGWVPVYGPDLVIVPQLVEMGDAGTEAAVLLADGLLPIMESLQGSAPSINAVVIELANAQPELVAAAIELDQIAVTRSDIPAGPYSPLVEKLLSLLDEYLPLAQTGLGWAQVVPEVMGLNEPRTYLVIAQNEDEVRPTGGFISSVGLLTVSGGELSDLAFEDSYLVDDWKNNPYPELPVPFQQIMGDGIWLFRDANWSPDWPTSARQAISLYQIGRDAQIDGVVAVNQRAVQMLVGLLEPLDVGESSDPVTAGNVLEFMREAYFHPAEGAPDEWAWYRKAFIGALAATMQEKLLADLGSIDLVALLGTVRAVLDQKHVLIYFPEPGLQAAVRDSGWGGALRNSPGDFLMVVDANMGFNKVAPSILQQIEYRVSLADPAVPEAQVRLTYTHLGAPRDQECDHQPYYDESVTSYHDLLDRCYWDYVRVYPPPGATPLTGSRHPLPGRYLTSGRDWSGEMVVEHEFAGRLSLANFLLLGWGESQTVQFSYRLPPSVITSSGEGLYRYQLLVQKQPGTIGTPLLVVVQLPPGADLVAAAPPVIQSGDEVVYEVDLVTDQELAIEWAMKKMRK